MSFVNMLLSLPAGRQMLSMPPEQNAPLEALMRQLRDQAGKKIEVAHMRGQQESEEFWRLVSTCAKYMARAFKREHLKRDKSQATQELLEAMASPAWTSSRDVGRASRFIGAQSFQLPEMSEANCLLEVAHLAFAPWVEIGDCIRVDFTVQMLTADGLYLVALAGGVLAIRGFHKSSAGWFVHENGGDMPQRVRVPGDRRPEGYEIVGRIVDVFKKNALSGRRDGDL